MEDIYPYDDLERVKRVNAPPFLYTRIKAKIQEQSDQVSLISVRWVYAAGVAVILLLLVNGFAISKRLNSDNSEGYNPSTIIASMELRSSNYLYDE